MADDKTKKCIPTKEVAKLTNKLGSDFQDVFTPKLRRSGEVYKTAKGHAISLYYPVKKNTKITTLPTVTDYRLTNTLFTKRLARKEIAENVGKIMPMLLIGDVFVLDRNGLPRTQLSKYPLGDILNSQKENKQLLNYLISEDVPGYALVTQRDELLKDPINRWWLDNADKNTDDLLEMTIFVKSQVRRLKDIQPEYVYKKKQILNDIVKKKDDTPQDIVDVLKEAIIAMPDKFLGLEFLEYVGRNLLTLSTSVTKENPLTDNYVHRYDNNWEVKDLVFKFQKNNELVSLVSLSKHHGGNPYTRIEISDTSKGKVAVTANIQFQGNDIDTYYFPSTNLNFEKETFSITGKDFVDNTKKYGFNVSIDVVSNVQSMLAVTITPDDDINDKTFAKYLENKKRRTFYFSLSPSEDDIYYGITRGFKNAKEYLMPRSDPDSQDYVRYVNALTENSEDTQNIKKITDAVIKYGKKITNTKPVGDWQIKSFRRNSLRDTLLKTMLHLHKEEGVKWFGVADVKTLSIAQRWEREWLPSNEGDVNPNYNIGDSFDFYKLSLKSHTYVKQPDKRLVVQIGLPYDERMEDDLGEYPVTYSVVKINKNLKFSKKHTSRSYYTYLQKPITYTDHQDKKITVDAGTYYVTGNLSKVEAYGRAEDDDGSYYKAKAIYAKLLPEVLQKSKGSLKSIPAIYGTPSAVTDGVDGAPTLDRGKYLWVNLDEMFGKIPSIERHLPARDPLINDKLSDRARQWWLDSRVSTEDVSGVDEEFVANRNFLLFMREKGYSAFELHSDEIGKREKQWEVFDPHSLFDPESAERMAAQPIIEAIPEVKGNTMSLSVETIPEGKDLLGTAIQNKNNPNSPGYKEFVEYLRNRGIPNDALRLEKSKEFFEDYNTLFMRENKIGAHTLYHRAINAKILINRLQNIDLASLYTKKIIRSQIISSKDDGLFARKSTEAMEKALNYVGNKFSGAEYLYQVSRQLFILGKEESIKSDQTTDMNLFGNRSRLSKDGHLGHTYAFNYVDGDNKKFNSKLIQRGRYGQHYNSRGFVELEYANNNFIAATANIQWEPSVYIPFDRLGEPLVKKELSATSNKIKTHSKTPEGYDIVSTLEISVAPEMYRIGKEEFTIRIDMSQKTVVYRDNVEVYANDVFWGEESLPINYKKEDLYYALANILPIKVPPSIDFKEAESFDDGMISREKIQMDMDESIESIVNDASAKGYRLNSKQIININDKDLAKNIADEIPRLEKRVKTLVDDNYEVFWKAGLARSKDNIAIIANTLLRLKKEGVWYFGIAKENMMALTQWGSDYDWDKERVRLLYRKIFPDIIKSKKFQSILKGVEVVDLPDDMKSVLFHTNYSKDFYWISLKKLQPTKSLRLSNDGKRLLAGAVRDPKELNTDKITDVSAKWWADRFVDFRANRTHTNLTDRFWASSGLTPDYALLNSALVKSQLTRLKRVDLAITYNKKQFTADFINKKDDSPYKEQITKLLNDTLQKMPEKFLGISFVNEVGKDLILLNSFIKKHPATDKYLISLDEADPNTPDVSDAYDILIAPSYKGVAWGFKYPGAAPHHQGLAYGRFNEGLTVAGKDKPSEKAAVSANIQFDGRSVADLDITELRLLEDYGKLSGVVGEYADREWKIKLFQSSVNRDLLISLMYYQKMRGNKWFGVADADTLSQAQRFDADMEEAIHADITWEEEFNHLTYEFGDTSVGSITPTGKLVVDVHEIDGKNKYSHIIRGDSSNIVKTFEKLHNDGYIEVNVPYVPGYDHHFNFENKKGDSLYLIKVVMTEDVELNSTDGYLSVEDGDVIYVGNVEETEMIKQRDPPEYEPDEFERKSTVLYKEIFPKMLKKTIPARLSSKPALDPKDKDAPGVKEGAYYMTDLESLPGKDTLPSTSYFNRYALEFAESITKFTQSDLSTQAYYSVLNYLMSDGIGALDLKSPTGRYVFGLANELDPVEGTARTKRFEEFVNNYSEFELPKDNKPVPAKVFLYRDELENLQRTGRLETTRMVAGYTSLENTELEDLILAAYGDAVSVNLLLPETLIRKEFSYKSNDLVIIPPINIIGAKGAGNEYKTKKFQNVFHYTGPKHLKDGKIKLTNKLINDTHEIYPRFNKSYGLGLYVDVAKTHNELRFGTNQYRLTTHTDSPLSIISFAEPLPKEYWAGLKRQAVKEGYNFLKIEQFLVGSRPFEDIYSYVLHNDKNIYTYSNDFYEKKRTVDFFMAAGIDGWSYSAQKSQAFGKKSSSVVVVIINKNIIKNSTIEVEEVYDPDGENTRYATMSLEHGASREIKNPQEFWDHVGEGERFQAFGYGFYLTDKRSVSQEYANKEKRPIKTIVAGEDYYFLLSGRDVFVGSVDWVSRRRSGDLTSSLSRFDFKFDVDSSIEKVRKFADLAGYKNTEKFAEFVVLMVQDISWRRSQNTLYRILLDNNTATPLFGDNEGHPFNIIGWNDKIGSENALKINKELKDSNINLAFTENDTIGFDTAHPIFIEDPKGIYQIIVDGIRGKELGDTFGYKEAEISTSKLLARAGIDGWHYEDNGNNYVIINPNIVASATRIEDDMGGDHRFSIPAPEGIHSWWEDGHDNEHHWVDDPRLKGTKVTNIVFHGTSSLFDAFELKKMGSNFNQKLASEKGFFFAKTKDAVSRYKTSMFNERPTYEPIANAVDDITGMIQEYNQDYQPGMEWRYYYGLLDQNFQGKSNLEARRMLIREYKYFIKAMSKRIKYLEEMKRIRPDIKSQFISEIPLREFNIEVSKNAIDMLENIPTYKLKARVIPVRLALKNPLVVDLEGSEYTQSRYADIFNEAAEKKNDGIIIENVFDGSRRQTTVYIAFDPSQIINAFSGHTMAKNIKSPAKNIEKLTTTDELFSIDSATIGSTTDSFYRDSDNLVYKLSYINNKVSVFNMNELVGELNLIDIKDQRVPRGYMGVENVWVKEFYRNRGIAKNLYRVALKFTDIATKTETAVENIFRLYKSLGATDLGDFLLLKDKATMPDTPSLSDLKFTHTRQPERIQRPASPSTLAIANQLIKDVGFEGFDFKISWDDNTLPNVAAGAASIASRTIRLAKGLDDGIPYIAHELVHFLDVYGNQSFKDQMKRRALVSIGYVDRNGVSYRERMEASLSRSKFATDEIRKAAEEAELMAIYIEDVVAGYRKSTWYQDIKSKLAMIKKITIKPDDTELMWAFLNAKFIDRSAALVLKSAFDYAGEISKRERLRVGSNISAEDLANIIMKRYRNHHETTQELSTVEKSRDFIDRELRIVMSDIDVVDWLEDKHKASLLKMSTEEYNSGIVKYAFGGIHSKTANTHNLKKAVRGYLDEGVDVMFTKDFETRAPKKKLSAWLQLNEKAITAIWNDTGWLLGVDGKFRYEINDARAFNSAYAYFDRVLVDEIVIRDGVMLESVIQNTELIRSYPFLKFINISVVDGPPVNLGTNYNMANINKSTSSFKVDSRGVGTINIEYRKAFGSEPIRDGKSTRQRRAENIATLLMYEIQRAIQSKEGFTVGIDVPETGPVDSYKNAVGVAEASEVLNRLHKPIIWKIQNPPKWNGIDFDKQVIARYKPRKIVDKTYRSDSLEYAAGLALDRLAAEARQHATFESFSDAFSVHTNHGTYWHLTKSPKFRISSETGPRDMSSGASGQIIGEGALMVTSDLERWVEEYAESRNSVVMLDLSDVKPEDKIQVSRGFGNEIYLMPEVAKKAKVVGIYSIKQALALDNKFKKNNPVVDKESALDFWREANDSAHDGQVLLPAGNSYINSIFVPRHKSSAAQATLRLARVSYGDMFNKSSKYGVHLVDDILRDNYKEVLSIYAETGWYLDNGQFKYSDSRMEERSILEDIKSEFVRGMTLTNEIIETHSPKGSFIVDSGLFNEPPPRLTADWWRGGRNLNRWQSDRRFSRSERILSTKDGIPVKFYHGAAVGYADDLTNINTKVGYPGTATIQNGGIHFFFLDNKSIAEEYNEKPMEVFIASNTTRTLYAVLPENERKVLKNLIKKYGTGKFFEFWKSNEEKALDEIITSFVTGDDSNLFGNLTDFYIFLRDQGYDLLMRNTIPIDSNKPIVTAIVLNNKSLVSADTGYTIGNKTLPIPSGAIKNGLGYTPEGDVRFQNNHEVLMIDETTPKTWYHGTNKEFKRFSTGLSLDFGMHFGDLPAATSRARDYYLKTVYLTGKNLIETPDLDIWEIEKFLKHLIMEGYIVPADFSKFFGFSDSDVKSMKKAIETDGDVSNIIKENDLYDDTHYYRQLVVNMLIDKGYDGFYYVNKVEGVSLIEPNKYDGGSEITLYYGSGVETNDPSTVWNEDVLNQIKMKDGYGLYLTDLYEEAVKMAAAKARKLKTGGVGKVYRYTVYMENLNMLDSSNEYFGKMYLNPIILKLNDMGFNVTADDFPPETHATVTNVQNIIKKLLKKSKYSNIVDQTVSDVFVKAGIDGFYFKGMTEIDYPKRGYRKNKDQPSYRKYVILNKKDTNKSITPVTNTQSGKGSALSVAMFRTSSIIDAETGSVYGGNRNVVLEVKEEGMPVINVSAEVSTGEWFWKNKWTFVATTPEGERLGHIILNDDDVPYMVEIADKKNLSKGYGTAMYIGAGRLYKHLTNRNLKSDMEWRSDSAYTAWIRLKRLGYAETIDGVDTFTDRGADGKPAEIFDLKDTRYIPGVTRWWAGKGSWKDDPRFKDLSPLLIKEGKPIILYHGSAGSFLGDGGFDFTKLPDDKKHKPPDIASHFADNPETANLIAEQRGVSGAWVGTFYLTIKNPVLLRGDAVSWSTEGVLDVMSEAAAFGKVVDSPSKTFAGDLLKLKDELLAIVDKSFFEYETFKLADGSEIQPGPTKAALDLWTDYGDGDINRGFRKALREIGYDGIFYINEVETGVGIIPLDENQIISATTGRRVNRQAFVDEDVIGYDVDKFATRPPFHAVKDGVYSPNSDYRLKGNVDLLVENGKHVPVYHSTTARFLNDPDPSFDMDTVVSLGAHFAISPAVAENRSGYDSTDDFGTISRGVIGKFYLSLKKPFEFRGDSPGWGLVLITSIAQALKYDKYTYNSIGMSTKNFSNYNQYISYVKDLEEIGNKLIAAGIPKYAFELYEDPDDDFDDELKFEDPDDEFEDGFKEYKDKHLSEVFSERADSYWKGSNLLHKQVDRKIRTAFKELGYDGIVYDNKYEDNIDTNNTSIVVFDNRQIIHAHTGESLDEHIKKRVFRHELAPEIVDPLSNPVLVYNASSDLRASSGGSFLGESVIGYPFYTSTRIARYDAEDKNEKFYKKNPNLEFDIGSERVNRYMVLPKKLLKLDGDIPEDMEQFLVEILMASKSKSRSKRTKQLKLILKAFKTMYLDGTDNDESLQRTKELDRYYAEGVDKNGNTKYVLTDNGRNYWGGVYMGYDGWKKEIGTGKDVWVTPHGKFIKEGVYDGIEFTPQRLAEKSGESLGMEGISETKGYIIFSPTNIIKVNNQDLRSLGYGEERDKVIPVISEPPPVTMTTGKYDPSKDDRGLIYFRGKPVKLYHGSINKKFEVFDKNEYGTAHHDYVSYWENSHELDLRHKTFWFFSNSFDVSETYIGELGTGHIREIYLRTDKHIIENGKTRASLYTVDAKGANWDEVMSVFIRDFAEFDAFDVMRVRNVEDVAQEINRDDEISDVFVVKNESQIIDAETGRVLSLSRDRYDSERDIRLRQSLLRNRTFFEGGYIETFVDGRTAILNRNGWFSQKYAVPEEYRPIRHYNLIVNNPLTVSLHKGQREITLSDLESMIKNFSIVGSNIENALSYIKDNKVGDTILIDHLPKIIFLLDEKITYDSVRIIFGDERGIFSDNVTYTVEDYPLYHETDDYDVYIPRKLSQVIDRATGLSYSDDISRRQESLSSVEVYATIKEDSFQTRLSKLKNNPLVMFPELSLSHWSTRFTLFEKLNNTIPNLGKQSLPGNIGSVEYKSLSNKGIEILLTIPSPKRKSNKVKILFPDELWGSPDIIEKHLVDAGIFLDWEGIVNINAALQKNMDRHLANTTLPTYKIRILPASSISKNHMWLDLDSPIPYKTFVNINEFKKIINKHTSKNIYTLQIQRGEAFPTAPELTKLDFWHKLNPADKIPTGQDLVDSLAAYINDVSKLYELDLPIDDILVDILVANNIVGSVARANFRPVSYTAFDRRVIDTKSIKETGQILVDVKEPSINYMYGVEEDDAVNRILKRLNYGSVVASSIQQSLNEREKHKESVERTRVQINKLINPDEQDEDVDGEAIKRELLQQNNDVMFDAVAAMSEDVNTTLFIEQNLVRGLDNSRYLAFAGMMKKDIKFGIDSYVDVLGIPDLKDVPNNIFVQVTTQIKRLRLVDVDKVYSKKQFEIDIINKKFDTGQVLSGFIRKLLKETLDEIPTKKFKGRDFILAISHKLIISPAVEKMPTADMKVRVKDFGISNDLVFPLRILDNKGFHNHIILTNEVVHHAGLPFARVQIDKNSNTDLSKAAITANIQFSGKSSDWYKVAEHYGTFEVKYSTKDIVVDDDDVYGENFKTAYLHLVKTTTFWHTTTGQWESKGAYYHIGMTEKSHISNSQPFYIEEDRLFLFSDSNSVIAKTDFWVGENTKASVPDLIEKHMKRFHEIPDYDELKYFESHLYGKKLVSLWEKNKDRSFDLSYPTIQLFNNASNELMVTLIMDYLKQKEKIEMLGVGDIITTAQVQWREDLSKSGKGVIDKNFEEYLRDTDIGYRHSGDLLQNFWNEATVLISKDPEIYPATDEMPIPYNKALVVPVRGNNSILVHRMSSGGYHDALVRYLSSGRLSNSFVVDASKEVSSLEIMDASNPDDFAHYEHMKHNPNIQPKEVVMKLRSGEKEVFRMYSGRLDNYGDKMFAIKESAIIPNIKVPTSKKAYERWKVKGWEPSLKHKHPSATLYEKIFPNILTKDLPAVYGKDIKAVKSGEKFVSGKMAPERDVALLGEGDFYWLDLNAWKYPKIKAAPAVSNKFSIVNKDIVGDVFGGLSLDDKFLTIASKNLTSDSADMSSILFRTMKEYVGSVYEEIKKLGITTTENGGKWLDIPVKPDDKLSISESLQKNYLRMVFPKNIYNRIFDGTLSGAVHLKLPDNLISFDDYLDIDIWYLIENLGDNYSLVGPNNRFFIRDTNVSIDEMNDYREHYKLKYPDECD